MLWPRVRVRGHVVGMQLMATGLGLKWLGGMYLTGAVFARILLVRWLDGELLFGI